MMQIGRKPEPMTPAERQAKCRAIKRGTWVTYDPLTEEQLRALEDQRAQRKLEAAQSTPAAALPAPARKSLPAPASEPANGTASQKAFSPNATALALPQADDAGIGGAGDLRLSLPPAVTARLKSLLDRHNGVVGGAGGKSLTAAERAEAQGLLDIAEYFVVQRLRNRLAA